MPEWHIIHLEDDTIFQEGLKNGLADAWLPREKLVQVISLSEFDAVLRSRDFVIAILDGSFPRTRMRRIIECSSCLWFDQRTSAKCPSIYLDKCRKFGKSLVWKADRRNL